MKITNTYCLLSDLTQAQIEILLVLMPESNYFNFNPFEIIIGFTENAVAGTFIQRADDKIITYREMFTLLSVQEGWKGATESIIDTSDPVNNPSHYTGHPSGIECIRITEHMGFNLGNALKYIWRCDLKLDAVEDLKKARWYIDRELAKRTK